MAVKETIVFNGVCMGVHINPRGENDPHAMISILVEDDENWFKKVEFSAYWLGELIQQLEKAKTYLLDRRNATPDDAGYGFNLKEEK